MLQYIHRRQKFVIFSNSQEYDSVFCRCAAAYVLLAEEEATTITEAERLFKQALKSGMELSHCHTYVLSTQYLTLLFITVAFTAGKDTNLVVYIKRRLAMCARKLGRIKEAVKMMRDVSEAI